MGSFFPTRSRATSHAERMRIVKLFEQAIAERDLEAIALLTPDDITALDTTSSAIHGRDAFIEALEGLFSDRPGVRPDFRNFVSQNGGLLVSGFVLGPGEAMRLSSLWRIEFEGPLIAMIQSFRKDNRLSLPSLHARRALALPKMRPPHP